MPVSFSVCIQLMSLSVRHAIRLGHRAALQRLTRLNGVTDSDHARSDGLWNLGRS